MSRLATMKKLRYFKESGTACSVTPGHIPEKSFLCDDYVTSVSVNKRNSFTG
jgi:hypothetical protein